MDKKKAPAIQKLINKNKKEIIKLCFITPRQHCIIKTETLKFIEIIYLCVLFKSAETHEGNSVSDFRQDKPLLPLDSNRLFLHLLKKQIISLDTGGPCKSLVFKKSKVVDINPLQEKWTVNTDLGLCYIAIHFALINVPNKHAAMMEIWKIELREIWLDICLYECMEYLISELFDYGLVINISTKLQQNLLWLLGTLSAGQCFSLMDSLCCICLGEYKVNKTKNDIDINDFLLSRLTTVRENIYFLDDFEVIEMDRPEDYPRSVINHILFNVHFKFEGDTGFDYVPLSIKP